jgi:Flp pilus assembly protein TadG
MVLRSTPPARGPAPGVARDETGMLSLETVLVLPVLVLFAVGLLQVGGVVRDLLLVHEAARAAVRAAATTTGTIAAERAAREAAPELDALTVTVTPAARIAGDIVRVEVTVERTIGGARHTIAARAVARVEPTVVP